MAKSSPQTTHYLKIGNETDRVTVASILYKNGYSVAPVRRKKDGRSFEYYLKASLECPDIPDGELE